MTSREPSLKVENLVISYNGLRAVDDVSFDISAGEHFTLLGASGCGKTTTLRAIAGLETPVGGRITLNGAPAFDAAKAINLSPDKRGIAMVFQNYAVWPHMTVAENVSFGLRARGISGAELSEKVRRAVERVGLEKFAERSASQLSGGQQQRVALARSIALEPAMILFDEPLSNLDAKLRLRMRSELRELQQRLGFSSVYVTHDQEEALAMSDRIAIMNGGKIEQISDPATLYNDPQTAFVADFISGANLLDVAGLEKLDAARSRVRLANGQDIICRSGGADDAAAVQAAVKPAHVQLYGAAKQQGNEWKVKVVSRMFLGDTAEYVVEWAGLMLRSKQTEADVYAANDEVHMHIPPKAAVLVRKT
jgi:ABC-type Fe3+/spermidine/putrescine transport system ATPase subunit